MPQGEHFTRKAREELSGYYALIEHIDAQVGRVMDHLEKTGLIDNTYLIFASITVTNTVVKDTSVR